MQLEVWHETMSPLFEKFHLNTGQAPWPFHPALHHFSGPDTGDPHDHPWSFVTHILAGGYTEEVYTLLPDGGWASKVHHRMPGTAHAVQATSIHRILSLPQGECWTLVMPGPTERVSRFWRFEEYGVFSRAWNEPEFTKESGR